MTVERKIKLLELEECFIEFKKKMSMLLAELILEEDTDQKREVR